MTEPVSGSSGEKGYLFRSTFTVGGHTYEIQSKRQLGSDQIKRIEAASTAIITRVESQNSQKEVKKIAGESLYLSLKEKEDIKETSLETLGAIEEGKENPKTYLQLWKEAIKIDEIARSFFSGETAEALREEKDAVDEEVSRPNIEQPVTKLPDEQPKKEEAKAPDIAPEKSQRSTPKDVVAEGLEEKVKAEEPLPQKDKQAEETPENLKPILQRHTTTFGGAGIKKTKKAVHFEDEPIDQELQDLSKSVLQELPADEKPSSDDVQMSKPSEEKPLGLLKELGDITVERVPTPKAEPSSLGAFSQKEENAIAAIKKSRTEKEKLEKQREDWLSVKMNMQLNTLREIDHSIKEKMIQLLGNSDFRAAMKDTRKKLFPQDDQQLGKKCTDLQDLLKGEELAFKQRENRLNRLKAVCDYRVAQLDQEIKKSDETAVASSWALDFLNKSSIALSKRDMDGFATACNEIKEWIRTSENIQQKVNVQKVIEMIDQEIRMIREAVESEIGLDAEGIPDPTIDKSRTELNKIIAAVLRSIA